MMLTCASLMLKMWHQTVPELEVVLVRAICTPFSEFTRRWPLPCHGSKIEKEAELVFREVIAYCHVRAGKVITATKFIVFYTK